MAKFIVEGKEIEAHEHFTANLRLQLISGTGRVLAHECTGCKKMKLADSFRMNRGYVQSKCKECVIEQVAFRKVEKEKLAKKGNEENE